MTVHSVHVPVFETERLILREPQMEDGELIAEFLGSSRAQFVTDGQPLDYRTATRAFGHMAGLWLLRGYGPHIWTLKDGTQVGHGGPWFPATWPEPEFGWCIWEDEYEGKGYATEAMTRLRDWAWEELGFQTCVAFVDPDNHSSNALAKRLGGSLDPDGQHPFDDEPVDIWRFFPEGLT